MTRLILSMFAAVLYTAGLQAQTQDWTLQSCVTYALDNNLTVQQADLSARNAELTQQQRRFSRLPNINGSASAGYQFGRTIDPTTNSFNNTRIGFNSYRIDGGVVLFDGNRINSQIDQARHDVMAAELDAQNTRQTVALSVATAYLNILLSQEQLANAQTQRDLAEQQLAQTNRLIEVGQLAPNARLDLEAQLARNEQLLIEANNAVEIGFLQLKQLLQLDPAANVNLEVPDLVVTQQALLQDFDLDQVYQQAVASQPNVAAARARVESSKAGEHVAQAGNLPTLSLFGNLNTTYSSVARDFTSPNTANAVLVENEPQTIIINDNEVEIITFRTEGVTFPNLSYGDQLSENFGQALGVSLSVPIYNNHVNNINRERARLNVITAELNARQVNDQLKTDVQSAITSFRAARNTYMAAERSLEAAQAAYNDAQRRFDLGAINSFDFRNAVDNLDLARREMTRAKYQLLFNQKVVEFYQGQPLSF